MTDSEYESVYQHIENVWWNTSTSGIGTLLHREGVHNLRQLQTYIKNPGLRTIIITDNDGYERNLSQEQVQEITEVFSYMNHLQNQWGPIVLGRYHHASRSREEYLLFLFEHLPSDLPIKEDSTLANAAYDARSRSSSEEHDRAFVSSGRINPATHFSTLHWVQDIHDIQDYPLLRHPRDFANWKDSFHQVALIQRIHPTLAPSLSTTNSTTATPATIAAMLEHMYQVLLHCIRDDTGSSIVLKHSATRNPYLTFAELQQHYIMTNVLQARSLLSGIVSDTIPPDTPPSHIDEHITTFLNNIQTYNSLVDPTKVLTIDAQLTNFSNFIHRICDVDTVHEILSTTQGKIR